MCQSYGPSLTWGILPMARTAERSRRKSSALPNRRQRTRQADATSISESRPKMHRLMLRSRAASVTDSTPSATQYASVANASALAARCSRARACAW